MWPIKLNNAAILRQGALYEREVDEELQRYKAYLLMQLESAQHLNDCVEIFMYIIQIILGLFCQADLDLLKYKKSDIIWDLRLWHRMERLVEGAREPSSFLQWQKEMRDKDLLEELASIERRRLEGRISYEEAAMARTRLIERNQKTAQLKKEEVGEDHSTANEKQHRRLHVTLKCVTRCVTLKIGCLSSTNTL